MPTAPALDGPLPWTGSTHLLVKVLALVLDRLQRAAGVDERGAAARHNALLHRGLRPWQQRWQASMPAVWRGVEGAAAALGRPGAAPISRHIDRASTMGHEGRTLVASSASAMQLPCPLP